MSSMGDDVFLSQFQLLHTKIIAYTMETLAEMRVDHCTIKGVRVYQNLQRQRR